MKTAIMDKKKDKRNKKNKKNYKKTESYVPLKGVFGNAIDYHIYNMSLKDKMMGFGIGFGVGFIIIYVFFLSIAASVAVGAVVGVKAIPIWQEYKRKKRQKELLLQFKDMLEALVASFSAGRNTVLAFADAYKDMRELYGDAACITKELSIIYIGVNQNIILEELLTDFAKRSGLEDIESFANVFEVCNRRGGNMKDIIADTRSIINDKIEIEMNIKTAIASSQNELHIMMVMPLIICMASRSLVESNGMNIFSVLIKLAALGIFLVAYKLGKKLTEIQV